MSKGRDILLLIFLVSLLIIINYNFIDTRIIELFEESDFAIVERVIDGDTLVTSNGTHIRLLGINTPESGERYYENAKEFLEMVSLNKTVELRYGTEKKDKYGRTLAYVFIDGKSANREIVDEGYANPYFPSGKDAYYRSFMKAWEHCISNNKYLCKKSESKCADCIELKKLDKKEQMVVLYNNCSFSCLLNGWTIKDEGRKKFVFSDFALEAKKEVSVIVGNKSNSDSVIYWKNEQYVWTSAGDTLFLRDEYGELVLWKTLE